MQETMVPSLVQEDPTCLGAFKLMHLSLSAAATEALTPRTCAPQEEPLQWEASYLQLEKCPSSNEDPLQP